MLMKTTNPNGSYLQEQAIRLPNYFKTNKSKLTGFETLESFIAWYMQELNNNGCRCHYCDTSILEIRNLIDDGTVTGRRVRGHGLRGHNFEIDRKNSELGYTPENCVLSCYFCNNDKSNTFSYNTYKYVVGPSRKSVWAELTKKA